MTRETKIGLLVGLAFIIMIGVLLSEHVSSTTPPPHTLVGVAENVRNGTGLPAVQPNPTPIALNASNNPAPQNAVPTANELTATQPGTAVVDVKPPTNAQPLVIENRQDQASNTVTPTPGTPSNNNPAGPIVALTRQQQSGTDLIPANMNNNDPTIITRLVASTQPVNPQGHPAIATKDYVAQSGDTLSKIASKIYGKNTKSLRDGIVAANTSLKSNPDKIIVGHTYQIPLLNQSSASANANAPTNLISPTTRPAPTPAAQVATRTCTAREGDTLWKIAARELGNGANWQQIADLNRDTLKGGTNIKPGMTLKLPAAKQQMALAR